MRSCLITALARLRKYEALEGPSQYSADRTFTRMIARLGSIGPWGHHAPDDQLQAAVAALASIPGPEADEALTELATASPYARGRVAELVLAARPPRDAGAP